MQASASAEDTSRDVYDQMVNGTYTMFHLLSTLAEINDTDGSYAGNIEAVEKGLDEIDDRATTVEQQIVNGLYNCVQMAGILSMQYA